MCFLIAFHLSVPLPHFFIGSGIPGPWCPGSLRVRGLDLISDSVICQLDASIAPMLAWCLNSSIRQPNLSDACPVGSCALEQNGRSLGQRQSAQWKHSILPEEQQKFFKFSRLILKSKINPFYEDKYIESTHPMKIISVENSSSVYYGWFPKRKISIFPCYDAIIKMQTLKQTNKPSKKWSVYDILLVTITLSRRFCINK